jgi:DeoR/GlpR family transcriptional regulator of sugar metabolism
VEAGVQRSLVDVVDEVVLGATHEAFGTSPPAPAGPLDRPAAVVRDRRPPAGLDAGLQRAGVVPRVVGS